MPLTSASRIRTWACVNSAVLSFETPILDMMEPQAFSNEQGFVPTSVPNVIVYGHRFRLHVDTRCMRKNIQDVQRRLWELEVLNSPVTEP